jgi:hypothetical protein
LYRRWLSLAAFIALAAGFTSITAQTPKPKHINRAIELLEQGQPVYCTGSLFAQVLATGVHGIMLTHADTPGADPGRVAGRVSG